MIRCLIHRRRIDAALDRDAPPPPATRLHMERCPGCRARHAAGTRVGALLRAGAPPEPAAPPMLTGRAIARTRRSAAPRRTAHPARVPAVLAAGVCLLLAVGLGTHLHLQRREAERRARAAQTVQELSALVLADDRPGLDETPLHPLGWTAFVSASWRNELAPLERDAAGAMRLLDAAFAPTAGAKTPPDG